jgi:hypothetical protein
MTTVENFTDSAIAVFTARHEGQKRSVPTPTRQSSGKLTVTVTGYAWNNTVRELAVAVAGGARAASAGEARAAVARPICAPTRFA